MDKFKFVKENETKFFILLENKKSTNVDFFLINVIYDIAPTVLALANIFTIKIIDNIAPTILTLANIFTIEVIHNITPSYIALDEYICHQSYT